MRAEARGAADRMIGVLADDFTGAAEIGGVALRYGLEAAIACEPLMTVDSPVAIFNTQSRGLQTSEAASVAGAAARELRRHETEWVYKKIDSVLRGPVVAELRAAMDALEARRSIIVPGNPALGRTVSSGVLRVNGRPIHETPFSEDPEYPARSSRVLEILCACDDDDIRLASAAGAVPDQGIVVGEAASEDDLRVWARYATEPGVLPAGSSSFFAHILEARGHRVKARENLVEPERPGTCLWINGASGRSSRVGLAPLCERGIPILQMPETLFQGTEKHIESAVRQWAHSVAERITEAGFAGVAIGRAADPRPDAPARLSLLMGRTVDLVLELAHVDHLLLEGGATAWAVLNGSNASQFAVVWEWASGVVTLRCGDGSLPLVTVKPGSYAWPENLLCAFVGRKAEPGAGRNWRGAAKP